MREVQQSLLSLPKPNKLLIDTNLRNQQLSSHKSPGVDRDSFPPRRIASRLDAAGSLQPITITPFPNGQQGTMGSEVDGRGPDAGVTATDELSIRRGYRHRHNGFARRICDGKWKGITSLRVHKD